MTPPPATVLIEAARSAMSAVQDDPAAPDRAREARLLAASRALDAWKPAVDELTDVSGAAAWLGLKGPDSIRGRMRRIRVDGTPQWPEPDKKFPGKKLWTYRTLAIHKASEPGRGHPGRARGPRQPADSRP